MDTFIGGGIVFFTTFQHYIGYSSHYIYTFSMHRGKKGETEIGYTERHGIPPQQPWFFYVPGLQLQYTGSSFYVLIRRMMMNTMDIYNEKLMIMWEAPRIELGSSA